MVRTYKIEFNNSGSMGRFILLYNDLFVPFSESTIAQCNYSKEYYDRKIKRGHKIPRDDNKTIMMRKGYIIDSNNMLRIHVEPEDFKRIKEVIKLKKENIRPNSIKYVYNN